MVDFVMSDSNTKTIVEVKQLANADGPIRVMVKSRGEPDGCSPDGVAPVGQLVVIQAGQHATFYLKAGDAVLVSEWP